MGERSLSLSRFPSPAERLAFLPQGGIGFWLDTAAPAGPTDTYSLLGRNPFLTFTWYGTSGRLDWGRGGCVLRGDPWRHLRLLLAPFRAAAEPPGPRPFAGGAVGYFGYDLGRYLEAIPSIAAADTPFPDAFFAFYDRGLILDHASERIRSFGPPPDAPLPAPIAAAAEAAIESSRRESARFASRSGQEPGTRVRGVPPGRTNPFGWNLDREAHLAAVRLAREAIAAGEIFQVNLSRRLALPPVDDVAATYLRLREVNPEPYAAFLTLPGGRAIASASPELFLRLEGERVTTRPIKGTRRRGTTREEDASLRHALASSVKDRAELTMIVDLERNDLGRVCRPGSVTVPELLTVEAHPHVYHLVGTVCGDLRPGTDPIDLVAAAFPGGSITGAPKVRAMEIIESLEPTRRGPYTGALGYIGFDGDLCLNILIRTFLIAPDRIFLQVGGGIVADSDPVAEYEETLDKAAGLLRALGLPREVGA